MKRKAKILLAVLLILFLTELGSRIYKYSITDVWVTDPHTKQETFYYNGHEYIDLWDFVDECVAEGILLEGGFYDFPKPYRLIWKEKDLVKKYVTGYGNLSEKLYDPYMYVYIDKADKDNNLMLILDDELRYIRKDFIFPSVEINKVEAIVFDVLMENMTTDEQIIADFIDAIYEKGEVTDKISEYLDKEYDTRIYFKYEGYDCVIEFIGIFSIEDGKFTMFREITEW